MQYALLVGGLIMLVLGVRGIIRARWLVLIYYGLASATGGIGVAFWPMENAQILDRLCHTMGVGTLVMNVNWELSFLSQFAFLTTLNDAWTRWRRLALGAGGSLILLLFPAWIQAQAAARDSARLFYEGYYGRPLALLVWNLSSRIPLMGFVPLAIYAGCTIPRVALDRRSRGELAGLIVLDTATIVYVALGIVGALTDRFGWPVPDLFGPSRVLFIVGGISVALLGAATVTPDHRRFRWHWLSLVARERELWQIRADLIGLSALVSDWLVFLRHEVDPYLVQAMVQRCELATVTGTQFDDVPRTQHLAQRWRNLTQAKRQVVQARRDLLILSAYVSDWMVLVRDPAILTLARMVRQRCQFHAIPIEQYRVAQQALSLILFGRAIRATESWEHLDALAAHAIDQAIARDALRRTNEGIYFYTDVYRVMTLILAPTLLPLSPRYGRESRRWHNVVATQVAQVLHTYYQVHVTVRSSSGGARG